MGGESRMSDTDKFTIDVGETLKEHRNGGPVVSRLQVGDVGHDVRRVKARVDNLRKAVETDLHDSYSDVHVWANDGCIAVVDHKKLVEGETARPLSDFSESVVRADVVDVGDECRRTQVDRDATVLALKEFGGEETVEVLVAQNFPLIFRNHEGAVGIAPIATPSDIPNRAQRKAMQ